jgi:hypothetical protein
MVDDFCKIYYSPRKTRTIELLSKLSDSEVITMEIVGGYLGLDSDKSIHGRHFLAIAFT